MRGSTYKVAFLAVLLATVFLGAQLHFCTDVTSASSHICPVCSTADSAAPTAPIHFTGLVPSHRIETPASVEAVTVVLRFVLSPRAPPAL